MILPVPKPVPGRKAPRPKLAATIVLLREIDGTHQILMGKRSRRHDFMPDVYVFPGGRVDRGDSYAPALDAPHPRTLRILQQALPPARARACIMAAVRETFEETALIIGAQTDFRPRPVKDKSWQAFLATGFVPRISDIELFGRAITPPFRDKRFDTWFFLKRMSEAEACCPFSTSAELVETGWFTLAEIEKLPTHRATDMMLEQLKIYLDQEAPPNDIFFSRVRGRRFCFSRFPEQ
ncbi:MAG TPA: NUDIX hydrolase [Hellea balneolensis]|uniref:NUDIX hydrolase n=1 Tax=Hellea balneolensis TaxID=287478 RepID=A0A7V5U1A2_9PROT|nr:NUDIX hydrolase [Hellea balneolensis]